MRIVSLLLVCAPIVCFGFRYTANCRCRSNSFGCFVRFFSELSASAALCGGNLRELLQCGSIVSEKGFSFQRELLLCLRHAPPGESWETALKKCKESRYLSPNEMRYLKDFSQAFSENSLQSFRSVCDAYARACGAWYTAAAEKSRISEKLGITLTSLTAALLFIVLI